MPVLYHFCVYFLPHFFRFSSVDFWLGFGSVLASAPSYRALRYGSPPRTFPGITADTGKKAIFDMVLTEREGADLPPPCHVFALDTIAALLPHICPRFSPVFRVVFAALKPIKRSLHAPARNDVRLSQILKRCELHAAVNNSGCFLACQCLLIVERTEDHNESAEIFDLQRVQLLDCCPQFLRGKIRSG